MVLTESDSELARGDAAPAFDLPGVDGRTHSLEEFSGEDALLVVFTCNHCPYAQAKFDLLNDVAAEYDDCAVVGINPNDAEAYPEDSFEAMAEFVEDGRVAYDVYLRDETQEVARAYGAVCTPDPFLFRREADGDSDGGDSAAGADGRFELAYHGRLDDALNPDDEPEHVYIRDAIDAVLAGEPVPHDDLPSQGCSIKWLE
ncbi:thioredoxin family protein [Halorarum halobium]|uniref:thioredoxin family protein n=1 Tax=Halorarum halobium TaxID=3075121 RepID=UPI0028AEBB3A|nr:thioredoxin family protein [Halobaculum sp. XH14]